MSLSFIGSSKSIRRTISNLEANRSKTHWETSNPSEQDRQKRIYDVMTERFYPSKSNRPMTHNPVVDRDNLAIRSVEVATGWPLKKALNKTDHASDCMQTTSAHITKALKPWWDLFGWVTQARVKKIERHLEEFLSEKKLQSAAYLSIQHANQPTTFETARQYPLYQSLSNDELYLILKSPQHNFSSSTKSTQKPQTAWAAIKRHALTQYLLQNNLSEQAVQQLRNLRTKKDAQALIQSNVGQKLLMQLETRFSILNALPKEVAQTLKQEIRSDHHQRRVEKELENSLNRRVSEEIRLLQGIKATALSSNNDPFETVAELLQHHLPQSLEELFGVQTFGFYAHFEKNDPHRFICHFKSDRTNPFYFALTIDQRNNTKPSFDRLHIHAQKVDGLPPRRKIHPKKQRSESNQAPETSVRRKGPLSTDELHQMASSEGEMQDLLNGYQLALRLKKQATERTLADLALSETIFPQIKKALHLMQKFSQEANAPLSKEQKEALSFFNRLESIREWIDPNFVRAKIETFESSFIQTSIAYQSKAIEAIQLNATLLQEEIAKGINLLRSSEERGHKDFLKELQEYSSRLELCTKHIEWFEIAKELEDQIQHVATMPPSEHRSDGLRMQAAGFRNALKEWRQDRVGFFPNRTFHHRLDHSLDLYWTSLKNQIHDLDTIRT